MQSSESKDEWIRARAKALNLKDGQGTADSEYQWEFFQKYKIFTTDVGLPEERLRFVQDLNVRLGIQHAILPFARVADMSLAGEALKRVNK